MRYYASGYYYAAKRQRQDKLQDKPMQLAPVLASGAPPKIVAAPADANALQTAK